MRQRKQVVVLNGDIINVGAMERMPEGAVLEERDMVYTDTFGWREAEWTPPVSKDEQIEKLKQEDLNNKEAIAELYMLSMGGF